MTLRRQLEPFAANGHEAFRIVDTLFEAIITALRGDQRFGGIPPAELDLLLADLRRDTERCLFEEMRDRVHIDDVDDLDGEWR